MNVWTRLGMRSRLAKRHSAEQIVRKLREAEVELAKGGRIKDACRKRFG